MSAENPPRDRSEMKPQTRSESRPEGRKDQKSPQILIEDDTHPVVLVTSGLAETVRDMARSLPVVVNTNGTLFTTTKRLDRVVARVRDHGGRVLLFGHGHSSCALTARWLELDVTEGRHFVLNTATVSILGWDLMDASPNEYNVPWTVHGALFSYGVGLRIFYISNRESPREIGSYLPGGRADAPPDAAVFDGRHIAVLNGTRRVTVTDARTDRTEHVHAALPQERDQSRLDERRLAGARG